MSATDSLIAAKESRRKLILEIIDHVKDVAGIDRELIGSILNTYDGLHHHNV